MYFLNLSFFSRLQELIKMTHNFCILLIWVSNSSFHPYIRKLYRDIFECSLLYFFSVAL